jgi:hypothetical protein
MGNRKGVKMKKKPIIKIKHKVYIHYSLKIWIFRFSLYILGKKFSARIEIANGWDD